MQEKVEILSAWFEKAKRDLPWRKSLDPYLIWISEVMLQQTTVKVVVPYYFRFIERFPTLKSLASSREEEVLSLWSGLGYYSRAKNLRRGAEVIEKNFKGRFPQDRETLESIPGIGPYTAGAILSIAFDQKEAIVDGNVKRVFARCYGIRKIIDDPKVEATFWKYSREWVEHAQSPRNLNQALMELGALLCTKADPQCHLCPLSGSCKAYFLQIQHKLPLRKKRKAAEPRFLLIRIYEQDKKLCFQKNESGWWKGLWDFPKEIFETRDEFERALRNLKKQRCEVLGTGSHVVTHHKIAATPVYFTALATPPPGTWRSRKDPKLPLSSLSQKILNLL